MRLGAMTQGWGGKVRGESEHFLLSQNGQECSFPGMHEPWNSSPVLHKR